MRILGGHGPTPAELIEEHVAFTSPRPSDRAFVRLNMVSSADGGSAIGGVSGGLGNRDDHAVFAAGALVPAIRLAQTRAQAQGRRLVFVAFVCGTEEDPQIRTAQEAKLLEAGCLLGRSSTSPQGWVKLKVGGHSTQFAK